MRHDLLTLQVPPFRHGFGEQSSLFISQLIPVYPFGHEHRYELSWSYDTYEKATYYT